MVFIHFSIAYKIYFNENNRIIGGTIAKNESYFVSIRIKSLEEKSSGQGHICGGTLVHDGSVVLTAAHCLFYSIHGKVFHYKPEELTAVIGSLELKVHENAKIQEVTKFYIHENYTKTFTKNQNDIAALWLKGSVLDNSNKLHVIDFIDRMIEPDKVCKITGFGRFLSVSFKYIPTNLE